MYIATIHLIWICAHSQINGEFAVLIDATGITIRSWRDRLLFCGMTSSHVAHWDSLVLYRSRLTRHNRFASRALDKSHHGYWTDGICSNIWYSPFRQANKYSVASYLSRQSEPHIVVVICWLVNVTVNRFGTSRTRSFVQRIQ